MMLLRYYACRNDNGTWGGKEKWRLSRGNTHTHVQRLTISRCVRAWLRSWHIWINTPLLFFSYLHLFRFPSNSIILLLSIYTLHPFSYQSLHSLSTLYPPLSSFPPPCLLCVVCKQGELEKLNQSTDDINRWETELEVGQECRKL